jgi:ABC-type branched-subunit amino acid transport system substrate-binding protein
MDKILVLVLRPEGEDPSPVDQSLGARLSAAMMPAGSDILVKEEQFHPDDPGDLEKKLQSCQGEISAVVGATNVAGSIRLGELADNMNLLCFLANNNPVVWQGRRHVFHIGLPTTQTTAAVTTLLQTAGRQHVLLLHDRTEFQTRVAASMELALKTKGMQSRSQAISLKDSAEIPTGWNPDLVYVIFSDDRKALPIARAIRRQAYDIPVLFGRSLLRESFLSALGDLDGEFWFVDMFHRNGKETESQRRFRQVMANHGVTVPTANHAFGWDGLQFCALALQTARKGSVSAIDYLESGTILDGASGTCSFTPQDHNGRFGNGPTTLTRWHQRRLEDV